MKHKIYTIIGQNFLLEDSPAAENAVAKINSNYESLAASNPDMGQETALLSMLLRSGASHYYLLKGQPTVSTELRVIQWAFQISTTELGVAVYKDVEDDLNKRYAKLRTDYPDKSFDELARIMLFQLYYPSWETIERCIEVAGTRVVKQTEIIDFLKGTFNIALDALDGLVQNGINLSDDDVVLHLMRLRKAIYLLPTDRVHCMDAPDVIKEFREEEYRFHKILSTPKQNAEDSFSADWVVGKLSYLKSQFDELELLRGRLAEIDTVSADIEYLEKEINKAVNSELREYAIICHNLLKCGSSKIGTEILDATSNIADSFMSEGMFKEAQEMLKIAVIALEKENPRIQQREERLSVTLRSLETAEKPFG